MMYSGRMVSFVHRDCGVDNFRLNSFLLDNWLNVMMYVMMSPLTSQHWCGGSGVLSVMSDRLVLELGCLQI